MHLPARSLKSAPVLGLKGRAGVVLNHGASFSHPLLKKSYKVLASLTDLGRLGWILLNCGCTISRLNNFRCAESPMTLQFSAVTDIAAPARAGSGCAWLRR